MSLKEYLSELKKFRNNINEKNIERLDKIINTIKKELPENYLIKLNALKIYEYVDEYSDDSDLPF